MAEATTESSLTASLRPNGVWLTGAAEEPGAPDAAALGAVVAAGWTLSVVVVVGVAVAMTAAVPTGVGDAANADCGASGADAWRAYASVAGVPR